MALKSGDTHFNEIAVSPKIMLEKFQNPNCRNLNVFKHLNTRMSRIGKLFEIFLKLFNFFGGSKDTCSNFVEMVKITSK